MFQNLCAALTCCLSLCTTHLLQVMLMLLWLSLDLTWCLHCLWFLIAWSFPWAFCAILSVLGYALCSPLRSLSLAWLLGSWISLVLSVLLLFLLQGLYLCQLAVVITLLLTVQSLSLVEVLSASGSMLGYLEFLQSMPVSPPDSASVSLCHYLTSLHLALRTQCLCSFVLAVQFHPSSGLFVCYLSIQQTSLCATCTRVYQCLFGQAPNTWSQTLGFHPSLAFSL